MAAGEQDLYLNAGDTKVNIWTKSVEHVLSKPIQDIQMPRAGKDVSTTDPSTLNIDIGRVKEALTIQGFLIDESTDSAVQKKARLLTIIRNATSVTATWGSNLRQQTMTGGITQCSISEAPGIVADDSQPSGYEQEKYFEVTVSIIKGTDAVNKGG